MGGEATPPTSSSPSAAGPSCSSSSPGGKRAREPEDEVYLDNFHNHKRYLSQMMAISLNGLTVGDSVGDNLMESPARSDSNTYYLRDEFLSPYSPMSEDSDDARYCDAPLPTSSALPDSIGVQTSPVSSPHRHQKQTCGVLMSNPYPLPGHNLPTVICSHARPRGSDAEGRFPSSPNDVCHSADLRRAALLRSVQMRAQPHCSAAYELPFDNTQDSNHCIEEADDRPFSEKKALEEDHSSGCESPVEQYNGMFTQFSSPDEPSNEKTICETKCCNDKYSSIEEEGSL